MGEHESQCCAFGCNKRFKKRNADTEIIRSDSEGPSDEETIKKRNLCACFTGKLCLNYKTLRSIIKCILLT